MSNPDSDYLDGDDMALSHASREIRELRAKVERLQNVLRKVRLEEFPDLEAWQRGDGTMMDDIAAEIDAALALAGKDEVDREYLGE